MHPAGRGQRDHRGHAGQQPPLRRAAGSPQHHAARCGRAQRIPHAQMHGGHHRAAVAAAPRALASGATATSSRNAHGPDPPARRPAHAAPPAAPSPAAAPGPAGRPGSPGREPRTGPCPRARPAAMSPPAGRRRGGPGTGSAQRRGSASPDRVVGHPGRRQVPRLQDRTQAQHPQQAAHAGKQHTRRGGFSGTSSGPRRPPDRGHWPSWPRQPGEQDIRPPPATSPTPPVPVRATRDGPAGPRAESANQNGLVRTAGRLSPEHTEEYRVVPARQHTGSRRPRYVTRCGRPWSQLAGQYPPLCAPAAVWPSRCQPAPNCPF